MDRQQSAKYYHQLTSRLCGQNLQQLLPITDAKGPILLAQSFWETPLSKKEKAVKESFAEYFARIFGSIFAIYSKAWNSY